MLLFSSKAGKSFVIKPREAAINESGSLEKFFKTPIRIVVLDVNDDGSVNLGIEAGIDLRILPEQQSSDIDENTRHLSG